MSSAAAFLAPRRSPTRAAADGVWSRWVTVAIEHHADRVGGEPGGGQGLLGRGHAHVDDGLVGRGDPALDDAGPLADPLVAGVDALDDLGVAHDPGRAVLPDPQDARRAARVEVSLMLVLTPGPPQGAAGPRAGPGETGSPSSTSHSMIVPPCGAITGAESRRPSTVPTGLPGSTSSPSPPMPVGVAEDALGRCDQHPPRRRLGDRARRGVPGHEVARGLEVVRALEGEGLDAGQRPLGQGRQGAGGRELEDGRDPEVGHGAHAEVPADRAGDLVDDATEDVAAVVDHRAVAVGQEPEARVVGRDGAREAAEGLDRGLHVVGVERARRPGAGAGARPRAGRPAGLRAARGSRRRRPGRRRWCWPGSGRACRARRGPGRGRRRGSRSCRWAWWRRRPPWRARARAPGSSPARR